MTAARLAERLLLADLGARGRRVRGQANETAAALTRALDGEAPDD